MRCNAPDPLHRPCSEAFTYTKDGWKLGIRQLAPDHPDPEKLPVVLCHGLGLNGTFWTITDSHLPQQLVARGYRVYICDLRGSGASQRLGRIGRVNAALRQTPFLELGEARWNVDDLVRYDVPAVLDYVKADSGSDRVNWVGHSLGGMLMFAFLETDPQPWRIANFVGMGSTIILADAPEKDMLQANRALRMLLTIVSTGRMARPMMYRRPPGLSDVDRFYYTAPNVDKRTIDRFYGYTLENPGRGALRQLDPYLEFGHFYSADRRTDYSKLLGRVTTPTLLVAGEGDIMSSISSTYLTFNGIASPDKSMLLFGKKHGHVDDYGHCDLVWSRYAPVELFPPVVDWLDRRQPGVMSIWPVQPSPQERFDAELRPGLELRPQAGEVAQGKKAGIRQAVLPGR
jgi:pimeloyl-ACP methyl ester carboxylesterase